jgi:hypothetical protein
MGWRWATEHLDAPQRTVSTVGTEAQAEGQKREEEFSVLGRSLDLRVDGLAEGDTAAREQSCAAAIGEEPVVTDANEALREDVKQEAATELGKREREGPRPATAVVLVAEGHGLVIDVEQPMVRDRDAVGVAGEVLEHALGTIARRLGVDDPLGADRLLE